MSPTSTVSIAKDFQRSTCNPIALPDYPRGRLSIGKRPETFGFLQSPPQDYRETADPSVLFHDGRWYLYPSCGMAYVSDDFISWRHVRVDPYDCGYAPTVTAPTGSSTTACSTCNAPVWHASKSSVPRHTSGPASSTSRSSACPLLAERQVS